MADLAYHDICVTSRHKKYRRFSGMVHNLYTIGNKHNNKKQSNIKAQIVFIY